jgi:hypothetical protein
MFERFKIKNAKILITFSNLSCKFNLPIEKSPKQNTPYENVLNVTQTEILTILTYWSGHSYPSRYLA